MKLCISTCFPKERNSLTSHYQIWSLFIQGVTMLTAHSPTSPLWSCLPSRGTRDHCWGSRGFTGERAEPFLSTGFQTPQTEKEQCVLKNQATASSHHLCHWLCGLLQCPAWKEINPPAKPKLSSDRFGHWMSSPRGPIKCQLVREEHRA